MLFVRRLSGFATSVVGAVVAVSSVALLGVVFDVPAVAAPPEPTGYTCKFVSGSARSYDKGRFKAEKASVVEFEVAAVDADKQSATIARGEAKGTLRVVRAVNALHFLEVVGEGYLNVTTIYDRDVKGTRHPAVHSRHFAVVGQPIVAQYQGFCAPR